MDLITRPIINPNPAPDLIALLAGDLVCRSCRGTGKVYVAQERNPRPCPMCRGKGTRS